MYNLIMILYLILVVPAILFLIFAIFLPSSLNWFEWFKQKIKKAKSKMEEFKKEVDPCEECIVRPCCHEHCDEYPQHVELINKRAEKVFYDDHKMPCCECTGFYEGPCGGASQNIICSECGERWNICPPIRYIEKI